jgi:tRNA(fMet)-specific endonuclease VapC
MDSHPFIVMTVICSLQLHISAWKAAISSRTNSKSKLKVNGCPGSVVVGELYFGAQKSARAEANLARINNLIDRIVVLGCNAETAQHYGRIKNALRIKGRPIPENDIWISASALQYDLTLATRDRQFAEVDSLKIETW